MKILILQEMANLLKDKTGLPYDIWIDEQGDDRNISHHIPRLKVDTDEGRIPVSIEKEPKILVDKDIPKFRIVKKWIMKNYDILIKRWNKEITNTELRKRIKKLE